MAKRQAQPILAGFSEDGRESFGREIVEFIDVQVKILSLVFRNVGSRHRRQLKLRHEKGAEEIALIRSKHAL